jgi:hypothetical protein
VGEDWVQLILSFDVACSRLVGPLTLGAMS